MTESTARYALRRNNVAATDAISRHLELLPKFLKDDPPFITARNVTGIMSKKGVTEYSQATDILSTVESKVNSSNDAERGRKWLQRFVEILLHPDIGESDVAKDIARSYVEKDAGCKFFSDIAEGEGDRIKQEAAASNDAAGTVSAILAERPTLKLLGCINFKNKNSEKEKLRSMIKMAPHWIEIAEQLEFDQDTIKNIIGTDANKTNEDRMRSTIMSWMGRDPKNSWRKLIDALENAHPDLEDTARMLEYALTHMIQ